MRKFKLQIEVDSKSIDELLDKIKILKSELQGLGLDYNTGNTLGKFKSEEINGLTANKEENL